MSHTLGQLFLLELQVGFNLLNIYIKKLVSDAVVFPVYLVIGKSVPKMCWVLGRSVAF